AQEGAGGIPTDEFAPAGGLAARTERRVNSPSVTAAPATAVFLRKRRREIEDMGGRGLPRDYRRSCDPQSRCVTDSRRERISVSCMVLLPWWAVRSARG